MLHQFIKSAFILGGLGTFLILLGMAIPGWMKDSSKDITAGLYMICLPAGCGTHGFQAGGIYAARAFIMIAFFCGIGGLVDGAIYYLKYFTKSIENRKLPLTSAVLYFIAAGTCFVGAIIFVTAGLREMTLLLRIALGVRYDLSATYCLGLAIMGALLSGGAGALTLIHLKKEVKAHGTTINPS